MWLSDYVFVLSIKLILLIKTHLLFLSCIAYFYTISFLATPTILFHLEMSQMDKEKKMLFHIHC